MSSIIPSFAIRSSSGIQIYNGPPKYDSNTSFVPESSKGCRVMAFSPDGKYFAWANGISVKIVLTENWSIVGEILRPKASNLLFSPKSTYLTSWEVFTVSKDNPQGSPNLFIYKTGTWEVVKSFVHKKQTNWELQWSHDEAICGRIVNNDVIFYERDNFERIVHRVNCAKIGAFSIAPGVAPYHVLCYSPGGQSQPALGRLFKYPNFEAQQSLTNKSFFQADKIDFYWNNKGTSALLLTSTEVDKTGASYYGKQTLHYMATNGNSAMVTLNKEGPIYCVAWSPKNTEFCVIYGFMPSRATIFNLKCETVFEFGAGPRNVIHYNPQGNILLLAGFGNLRGQVELWDIQNKKIINKCDAPDTTLLQWCPDGIHFLTATTAPRLRIGNGYKIWHYSGTLLHERPWNQQEELYDINWQSFPDGVFKEPLIKFEKIEGIATSQPQASKQVYRPPCARGRPVVNFKLHDDDDDETSGKSEKANISKATMKQKKKREAKKAKKQDNVESGDAGENEKDKSPGIAVILTGDIEKDKKLKNLKKKLDAINKLKEQQAAGKPLEINQIAKIKCEEDLLKELKSLQI